MITFDGYMKIRVVNRSAYPLPEYATAGSAGMDLRAAIDQPIALQPLERVVVPTGLFIELPSGFEAQIRPRSGLAAQHGLTLLNTPGTVDSDYRGEIKVIVINLSGQQQVIEPGQRIAQMVIAPYTKIEWVSALELDVTQRGAGGFGHSGSG